MYYALVGKGTLVYSGNSIIDARERLLNATWRTKSMGKICLSIDGTRIVEYTKWFSADLDYTPSPFMSRKANEKKWRGVTADGELFVTTKKGNRYYERR